MRTRLVLLAVTLAVSAAAPGAAPAATAADGGVWAPALETTRGQDFLTAFGNGVMYATYLDGYVRSRDHGRTWEPMTGTGQFSFPAAVRFATPTTGYLLGGAPPESRLVLGDAGLADEVRRCGGIQPLRRTTDGGASWRAVCVPSTKPLSEPYFSADAAGLSLAAGGRTIFLAGDEDPGDPAKQPPCAQEREVFYTSHDGGERWTEAQTAAGWFGGFRQYALDARTVARIVYGRWRQDDGGCESATSAVFLSRDGGRSFTNILTCPQICTSVALVTRSRFVVGRNDGSTLVTDDGGRRWRRGQRLFDARWQPVVDSGQLPKEAFWVQALSFVDARHGYASTRGSGTWRTTDGGVSWTQERSHECAYYLWGIGEVAAGTRDNAITGGPTFISARVPLADAPDGCGALQPNVPTVRATDVVAELAAAGGTLAVRADGSVSVNR